MKALCLDTSAYSKFMGGHEKAIEVIGRCRHVTVPSIVLGELRAGFRMGSRFEQNDAELRTFLSNPVVQVLLVDDDAADYYAEIIAELRKKGSPIPTNDIWIAALAMRDGATVLTFDSHFQRISRLAVMCLS